MLALYLMSTMLFIFSTVALSSFSFYIAFSRDVVLSVMRWLNLDDLEVSLFFELNR